MAKPTIVIIIERRISGVGAFKVIRQLEFSNSLVVDACGFAGGIWILLKADLVTITEFGRHGV
ncbi:hypothetical protein LINGRAHAP2_LOCUS15289 [Linum grandiflorum]